MSLLHMIVEKESHRYAVTNRMKLNRMKLNRRKCKEMIINFMTYDNIACRPLVINVVERVNSYKLLGLIINNTLSWCEHSLEKCKRASKRLFGLRQLKQAGINHKDLVMVYCTTIRPILEYASPAWLNIPLYISNQLEDVQRLALRIIYPASECNESLRISGLTLLSNCRNILCQKYMNIVQQPCHPLNHLLDVAESYSHGYSLRLGNSRASRKVTKTRRCENFILFRL
jgi:hypothetical protein